MGHFPRDAGAVAAQGNYVHDRSSGFSLLGPNAKAPQMNVLAIQPWVARGHVDAAATMACLHALGHEAWAVPTGIYSTPEGTAAGTGRVLPTDQVGELLAGIVARGRLAECAAVFTGNLGSAATGEAALAVVERVKTANPQALYLCDPELGVSGRVYGRPGIQDFLRDRALGRADIVTPNAFELSLLTGAAPASLSEASAAAAGLSARLRPGGPRMVLVMGLELAALPQQTVTLLVRDKKAAAVVTSRLDLPLGTGDALAALFLGRLLDGAAAEAALCHAASAVHALAERAAATARADLPLVSERAALIEPPVLWPAEPIA